MFNRSIKNYTCSYGLHASFLPLAGLPLAAFKSSNPIGYTYQSSDPEGYTYQSSEPKGCTYQSRDLEGHRACKRGGTRLKWLGEQGDRMEEWLATRAVDTLDCPRYGSGPSRLRRMAYVREIVDRSRKEKFKNRRGDTGGRRRNLNKEDYERAAVELCISAGDEWVRDCGGLCGRQKNIRD
ncbi:NBS-LRR type resistance protein [Cucumis melo var. makuwa]|uniref:NBS-LRR type resistance protein n=1 Tax=Cucumis melo var. makuwa TaxID=1194695 RepID=A0A5A7U1I3_CUCMM|nr:NBS-LRR type resistance protein [Cucumis melo var. makuwa]